MSLLRTSFGLLALVLLTGCGPSPQARLTGTWTAPFAFGELAKGTATMVLGAEGATLDAMALDNVGHIIFENVHFVLNSTDTDKVLSVKKVRGLRVSNCTFTGRRAAVDFNDGYTWMRSEPFRYVGTGVAVREGSYTVLQGCRVERANRHIAASVSSRSLAVVASTSVGASNDHIFLQQSTAIYMFSRMRVGVSRPLASAHRPTRRRRRRRWRMRHAKDTTAALPSTEPHEPPSQSPMRSGPSHHGILPL